MADQECVCLTCGKVFAGAPGDILCPDCAPRVQSTNYRTLKICQKCGKEFWGNGRAKYCAPCRRETQREQMKRTYINGTKRHIGGTDVCRVCGKEYIITNPNQVMCPDCQAVKEQTPERKAQMAKNFQRRKAAKKAYYKSFYNTDRKPRVVTVYSAYDRDGNFIVTGTAQEIAERLDITPGSVYRYASHPGKYRLIKEGRYDRK